MKRFLEDYGFTIVAAIVVISLIMIVTPIGSTIQKQTGDLVHSFAVVADDDFNKIDDSTLLIDLKNFNKSGVEGDFSRKGNLVTINNTQYRVLAVNGTQVKVMSMVNIGSSAFNSSNITTSFGDKNGQKYADSKLDQAMTNYYNGLPEAIRNAIVEQNISQSMYKWSNGTNTSANFSAWYKQPFNDATTSGNNYYLTRIAEVNVGARKVFALDLDDAISYLGANSTAKDVNELFFGVRGHVNRFVWLRSAGLGNSSYTFSVYGIFGGLLGYSCIGSYEVRPAFVLDLNLLS